MEALKNKKVQAAIIALILAVLGAYHIDLASVLSGVSP